MGFCEWFCYQRVSQHVVLGIYDKEKLRSLSLIVSHSHTLRASLTYSLTHISDEQPKTLSVTSSHRRVPPPFDQRPTTLTSIATSQAAGSLGQAAFVLKLASPAASSLPPGSPSPDLSSPPLPAASSASL
ncbi:hypothetical protein PIB30_060464 [Stylosanthes scabra]|uniref:Uncharacterized protein n=1 Tax=Stylosanthes scabra TaxID=79078 RepID=A0ABU6RKR9_9FABA|nr:hypothetical protein [Stylosanthes scabra]